ncbi:MAG: hypothetical protein WAS05_08470, partial [Candidatus Nanopelagicales bacterium]
AADGASQLAEGLNGKLLPGANALAAGADKLASGITGTLQPGANKLAKGLAAGADGSGALVDGAAAVNDAIQKIAAGVNGDPDNPDPTKRGLVPSLKSLKDSFTTPAPPAEGIPLVELGLNGLIAQETTAEGGTNIYNGLCRALVAGAGQDPDTFNLHNLNPSIPNGTTCPILYQTPPSPTAPYGGGLMGYIATVTAVSEGALEAFGKLEAGATAIYNGVTYKAPPGDPGLQQALNMLAAKTPALAAGAAKASSGLQAAAAGAGQLADGINDTLAPGAGALADGAQTLADGVPTAADGAQQLANGLPAAVEGAAKLSAGGKELEASGQAAASTFATNVNGIDAAQQLGVEGVGIPNGGKATGENVTTTGVYQITLQAAQTPEQNNGLRFGLAALALIVAGGVGTAIYRRRQGLGS